MARPAMPDKPFVTAAERNAGAILEVLRQELRDCSEVLEIGSGTGQHAVMFAAELDHLDWQTSDLEENHAAIHACLADAGLSNVRPPLKLDVRTAVLAVDSYDGVFSCNTAHIMHFEAVVDLFGLVGRVLRPRGVFCLYGPFRKGGRYNTDSNEQFDKSLKSRDAGMGLRDLEALDALGKRNSLERSALFAMPSNNLLAVWRKVQI